MKNESVELKKRGLRAFFEPLRSSKFRKRMIALVLALACTCTVFSIRPKNTPVDFTVSAVNIIKGDSSQNIRAVQTKLKDLGYYKLSVDGIFGSGTRNAVMSFQRANGLKVDGIVGPATEKALGITLSTSQGTTQTSSNDVYLLAKCIYAEARGEPYTGQVAVGAVVLNRVRSSKFPNTISGVIYQPWAFTAVNDGQINLSPNETAIKAAKDALNGWDPTNGCLYYYNPATATSKWIWSLTVSIKIGRHSFCKS